MQPVGDFQAGGQSGQRILRRVRRAIGPAERRGFIHFEREIAYSHLAVRSVLPLAGRVEAHDRRFRRQSLHSQNRLDRDGQYVELERFGHIAIGSIGHAMQHVFRANVSREHDNRDGAELGVRAQLLQ
jgi:hypothetical protein